MSKKIFVTGALPYCNNKPHIGNLVGSVMSGDMCSRYNRLQGYEVLYLCGTDDYGTCTEVKACQEGMTCEEICDKYNKLHKQIYDWFNIEFDIWGKTSTETQTKITQEIFLNLYKNGHIEERTITQMYCTKCNKFLADRYLKGTCYHKECEGKNSITNGDQCDTCQKFIDVDKIISPFCYMCKNAPTLKETEHLFLKLGDFTEEIRNKILNNNKVFLHDNAKAITKSWLDSGLESRCITRDLQWGTPIPWEYDELLSKYKNKVFYVWFDAPFGYYSILGLEKDKWLSSDIEWIAVHSKDNIPFHTIVFPSSIIGSGMNLPLITKICSTEYLLYENQKFSKSNNIGIFGDHVIEISKKLNLNEDYWRYYITKIRPENKDSSFNWNEFFMVILKDLIGNIGNYINRCVSLTNKVSNKTQYEPQAYEEILKIICNYEAYFEKFKFRKALDQCLLLSSYGNEYLQEKKPWKNINENTNFILGKANMIAYILITLLSPIIPRTSNNLLKVFIPDVKVKTINDLKEMLLKPCAITIDNSQYQLPFKLANKMTIKTLMNNLRDILSEIGIKASI